MAAPAQRKPGGGHAGVRSCRVESPVLVPLPPIETGSDQGALRCLGQGLASCARPCLALSGAADPPLPFPAEVGGSSQAGPAGGRTSACLPRPFSSLRDRGVAEGRRAGDRGWEGIPHAHGRRERPRVWELRPAHSRWVGLHGGLLASQGVPFLPFPPGIPARSYRLLIWPLRAGQGPDPSPSLLQEKARALGCQTPFNLVIKMRLASARPAA